MFWVSVVKKNSPVVSTSPLYVPFIVNTWSEYTLDGVSIVISFICLPVMTKVELRNEVLDPVAVNVEPGTMP
jgi:hypothetical protein